MTDYSNDGAKGVPLPTFSDETNEFELYWPKFEAYANLKGFADSIKESRDPNLPSKEDVLDATTDDLKKLQSKALVKNKLAVACFTMSFKTVALMNRISDAKTVDYPGGLAHLIAAGLLKKYRPTDRISKLEALVELNKITMDSDDEPDTLVNAVSAVKQTYRKSGIDDANYLNHVINSAPAGYQSNIAATMTEKGNNLTIEDVQESMNTIYRLRKNKSKHDGKVNAETSETALAGSERPRNNGNCYKCGQPGHKAYQCKARGGGHWQNNKKTARFRGTCNHCGRQGHKEASCWAKESNQHLRPKNWRKPTHGNQTETGASGIEYCMFAGDGFCSPCYNVSNEDDEPSANEIREALIQDLNEAVQEATQGIEDLLVNEENDNNDDVDDTQPLEDNEVIEESTGSTYVGPTYYRDPYETDSDQSVDGTSEDLDVDGNIIGQGIPFDAFDALIENTDESERFEPPRTYANEDFEALLNMDEEFDGSDDEEVINHTLAFRAAMLAAVARERAEDHEADESKESKDEVNLVSVSTVEDIMNDDEVWIGDSGATAHTTYVKEGIVNSRSGDDDEAIIMGNGLAAKADLVGCIQGQAISKQKVVNIKMNEVMYSPDARFNLFSFSAMIKTGWTLHGDKKEMVLSKGNAKLHFDQVVHTQKGMLFCIRIKRNKNEAGLSSIKENKAIDVETLHKRLGHGNEKDDKLTAKHLNIKVINGQLKPCAPCNTGKAKQKAVPKKSSREKSTTPGEMIYLDISTLVPPNQIKDKVKVRRSNWRLIVDAATNLGFSGFYDKKSDMIEPTCAMIHKWRQEGKSIKIIRCDNAGENYALEKRMKSSDWKLGDVQFEYTARATPQQNSPVEKKFDTIYGKARAMMFNANVTLDKRYVLGKEAIMTATLLDGLKVESIEDTSATRFEHWNSLPKWSSNLRTWGEAGVVKIKDTGTPKLASKGLVCMFVGYALNHASDCYRMYDQNTKRVHVTRDVRWLERMYFDTEGKVKLNNESEIDDDDLDIEIETLEARKGSATSIAPNIPTTTTTTQPNAPTTDNESSDESSDEDAIESSEPIEPSTRSSGRTSVKPTVYEPTMTGQRYEPALATIFSNSELAFYNALRVMDDFDATDGTISAGHQVWNEVNLVGAGIGGGFESTEELKPMKFREAMSTKSREGWIKAVDEEWKRFKQYDVFKPVLREDVPNGSKFVSTTWAMKKKASGKLRARMNMRGFEQRDQIHYDSMNIASPVTNDVTVRVCLVLMLMAGWMARLVDVNGAFLHGEFDNGEVIYTEVPEGFETYVDSNKYVLLLQKTCYGLKQAAMMFWKELLKAMKHMGFKRSNCDPCLYWKHIESRILLWLSWVDDCLCIGMENDVMKAKDELTKLFDCDDTGGFDEYVGCKIDIDRDNGTMKLTQPVLLQSYVDEFELPTYEYETPGEPGKVLTKVEDGQGVCQSVQTKFRSGVGKLLHMMRWSRPEIWNAVREVSRRMSIANEDHMKAMLRVLKYCADTPKRGWTLKPTRKWNGKDYTFEFKIEGKSDANFATCKDTRKSVTGYVVYMEDTPIAVKSGMQRIVALSVSEAEVIAMVQCVQEMLYVMKLLNSMELKVKLPMVIWVDNKAAVDLANGWSSSGGTKHIDVRLAFVRELKEEGKLIIKWIPTEENESDIYTKNVDSTLFNKHVSKLIGKDEYMWEKMTNRKRKGVRFDDKVK